MNEAEQAMNPRKLEGAELAAQALVDARARIEAGQATPIDQQIIDTYRLAKKSDQTIDPNTVMSTSQSLVEAQFRIEMGQEPTQQDVELIAAYRLGEANKTAEINGFLDLRPTEGQPANNGELDKIDTVDELLGSTAVEASTDDTPVEEMTAVIGEVHENANQMEANAEKPVATTLAEKLDKWGEADDKVKEIRDEILSDPGSEENPDRLNNWDEGDKARREVRDDILDSLPPLEDTNSAEPEPIDNDKVNKLPVPFVPPSDVDKLPVPYEGVDGDKLPVPYEGVDGDKLPMPYEGSDGDKDKLPLPFTGTPEEGEELFGPGELPPAMKEAEIQARLDSATDGFGKAKYEYEMVKNSGKKTKNGLAAREALTLAENELQAAFIEMASNIPETMHQTDELMEFFKQENSLFLNVANERKDDLLSKISELEGKTDPDSLEMLAKLHNRLDGTQAEIDGRINIANEIQSREEATRAEEANKYITARLTEIENQANQAVLDERAKRQGKFGKFRNWLQKHPKTKIATAIGLAGAGVIGTLTFNPALVTASAVGLAGLRGIGSYELTRGLGDLIANKRISKAEIGTIEEYFAASRKESDTRRRSKGLGVFVGTVMALAPIVADIFNHAQTVGVGHQAVVKPHVPNPVVKPPLPHTSIPPIQSIRPDLPEWTYSLDYLKKNISLNKTLGKIINNPYKIKLYGNNKGGGAGKILRVFVPGQGIFSDTGHINGVLRFLAGAKA